MLKTQHQKIENDIDLFAEKFGEDRSAMMPILQSLQRKYGRITDYAMQAVADKLGVHPVEVYGVVSFYSFLCCKTHGKFIIRLCRTISCDMAGKERVAKQLENDLGIAFGETTDDGMFTLEWANCLGMCDQGPAMLVNDQVFTKITPDKVYDIIQGCKKSISVSATEKTREQLL